MTQHKRGLFAVAPSLIIHAIIVIACLSLIVMLVGSLLSFPDDANAENELRNFINIVNAFADSDKESMDAFIAFDGSYFFVMFDNLDRGIGVHSVGNERDSGSSILRDTCGSMCLCSYGMDAEDDKSLWGKYIDWTLEESSSPNKVFDFPILTCESLNKQLIIKEGVKGRIGRWIVGPNNFEINWDKSDSYKLKGTGFNLLILGGSTKGVSDPRIGLSVTLVKMEDKILVHPKEVGDTPNPTELLIEPPKEIMCNQESEEICREVKYNSCVEVDGFWFRCNQDGWPEANLKTDNPICNTGPQVIGCP